MKTKVLFDNEAHNALFEGVKEITKAVASTLGPKGHTVMIDKGYGIPHITKDGVTVARAYDTEDIVKRMGATLVKTVAAKTCDEAGDGTTTATILTEALISAGLEEMQQTTFDPREFKKGLEDATNKALETIESFKTDIKEDDFDKVKQIAIISANGDEEIGTIITESISKVGNDGVVAVEENVTANDMEVEITTGFQYDKGITNPYFVTDAERMECILVDPYIAIFGQSINYTKELVPIVQSVYSEKRPLLVVAPNISNDVLKFLVMNVQQNSSFKACYVKAPSYGQVQKDMLQDMACKVGGKVIGDEYGLPVENVMVDIFGILGQSEKVVVNTTKTMIVGGKGTDEAVQERVGSIKSQLEESTNDYDKEKFRERIAKLIGGAAVIRVGANSEVEMREKKDRIDDAVAAVRAAIEEGYVPGGGTAYYHAAKVLTNMYENMPEDSCYRKGFQVVRNALLAPLEQLCENAGLQYSSLVKDLNIVTYGDENWKIGINTVTSKIENMIEAKIIDPYKVARVALENSVSVAIQFLNTKCVMAYDEQINKH